MHKVFIIAEAGVNHNGSFDVAKKLVDKAVWAGADAVKFQSFKAEEMVMKTAPKAHYQDVASGKIETQFTMLRKLELDETTQRGLFAYCRKKGIQFLSSPFDIVSIDFLASMGLKVFKIPSSEVTNLPYLRRLGRLRRRVILSTGMSYLCEVREALKILRNFGTRLKDIVVLHCNSGYPTPYEDVNLTAMAAMRRKLNVAVGYSDHTPGVIVPIAAVALGACVIEKHFTLDRSMQGPDHRASLEPDEFADMVRDVRITEKIMGSGIKKPSPSEIKNLAVARKSIVSRCAIKKGERFCEDNITTKRPSGGISPLRWDRIIGKTAKRAFEADRFIES